MNPILVESGTFTLWYLAEARAGTGVITSGTAYLDIYNKTDAKYWNGSAWVATSQTLATSHMLGGMWYYDWVVSDGQSGDKGAAIWSIAAGVSEVQPFEIMGTASLLVKETNVIPTDYSTSANLTNVSNQVALGATSQNLTNVSNQVALGATSANLTNVSNQVALGATSANLTNVSNQVALGATSANLTNVSNQVALRATSAHLALIPGLSADAVLTEAVATHKGVAGGLAKYINEIWARIAGAKVVADFPNARVIAYDSDGVTQIFTQTLTSTSLLETWTTTRP